MTEIVFPEVDKKSRETQAKMIARFNATILQNDFPEGAKVMTLDPIHSGKLNPRYEGPYTVIRRTTGGTYELKDGTGALLGRRYAPSQLKLVLEDINDLPVFEVEKILHHRPHPTKKGEWEYKAKWKGYTDKDCTWEPEENFIEKKCIREYWQKYNQLSQPAKRNATQKADHLRQRSKRTIDKRTPSPPRRSMRRKTNH